MRGSGSVCAGVRPPLPMPSEVAVALFAATHLAPEQILHAVCVVSVTGWVLGAACEPQPPPEIFGLVFADLEQRRWRGGGRGGEEWVGGGRGGGCLGQAIKPELTRTGTQQHVDANERNPKSKITTQKIKDEKRKEKKHTPCTSGCCCLQASSTSRRRRTGLTTR